MRDMIVRPRFVPRAYERVDGRAVYFGRENVVAGRASVGRAVFFCAGQQHSFFISFSKRLPRVLFLPHSLGKKVSKSQMEPPYIR